MTTLTEKQTVALRSVAHAPGEMAIVHVGKLTALGLVEKTAMAASTRGYSVVKITPAGSAALS